MKRERRTSSVESVASSITAEAPGEPGASLYLRSRAVIGNHASEIWAWPTADDRRTETNKSAHRSEGKNLCTTEARRHGEKQKNKWVPSGPAISGCSQNQRLDI